MSDIDDHSTASRQDRFWLAIVGACIALSLTACAMWLTDEMSQQRLWTEALGSASAPRTAAP